MAFIRPAAFYHVQSATSPYAQFPVDQLWVSPSLNLTAEEIDMIYLQNWPYEVWNEYLVDHGLPALPAPPDSFPQNALRSPVDGRVLTSPVDGRILLRAA